MNRRALQILFLLSLLTAVTWISGMDRFQFARSERIEVDMDPEAWAVGKSTGEFSVADGSLHFDGQGLASQISQEFPLEQNRAQNPVSLRVAVSLDVAREDPLERGKKGSAFLAWFADQNGNHFGYATVAHVEDAIPEERFVRVLLVPENAATLLLALVGREGTANVSASDLSVEQVQQSRFHPWVVGGLGIGWCATLLIMIASSGVAASSASRWLLAGLMLAILVGVSLPESLSMRLPEPFGDISPELIFKGGHFVLFFLLGAAFSAVARLSFTTQAATLAALAMLAVGTEGIQTHLVDRTARVSDVALDVAGITLALLMVCLARWIFRERSVASASKIAPVGEAPDGKL